MKIPTKFEKIEAKLESKIDEILRDERVLKVLSKNINNMIKIQNYATRRLEFVLRIADVPTLKGLNELFESVNHLEKETMKQRERILILEKRLAQLDPVESPMPMVNPKKPNRRNPKSMTNEI